MRIDSTGRGSSIIERRRDAQQAVIRHGSKEQHELLKRKLDLKDLPRQHRTRKIKHLVKDLALSVTHL